MARLRADSSATLFISSALITLNPCNHTMEPQWVALGQDVETQKARRSSEEGGLWLG
jgi:hypothetical protein